MSNMLYILGSTLAGAIGQVATICRGLLRLTIMDKMDLMQKASAPSQIETHIKAMSYQDWKNILDGPIFMQRLANIGVKEPVGVVAQLKRILVEQQSLLTMTAY